MSTDDTPTPVTKEEVILAQDPTEPELAFTEDSTVNTEKVERRKGPKPLALIKPLSIKNEEPDSARHFTVEVKNCLNCPNPSVKVGECACAFNGTVCDLLRRVTSHTYCDY